MDKQEQMVEVQRIRAQYANTKASKLQQLKKLDAKANLPGNIFAYSFGTFGALVLGVGMCLAMKVIGNMMALGIVIGCVGIAMVSVNYFVYKAITKRNKKKYESQIFQLSDEILNANK